MSILNSLFGMVGEQWDFDKLRKGVDKVVQYYWKDYKGEDCKQVIGKQLKVVGKKLKVVDKNCMKLGKVNRVEQLEVEFEYTKHGDGDVFFFYNR